MLKMRLQRVGRKHEPTFRLVLTESENSTKSGRFAEVLGSYDPRKMADSFKVERIKELLAQGVGLTGSVNNLLIKHGIIRGKKVHVGSNFVVKSVEEAPLNDSTESSSEQSESTVLAEPAPEEASEPQVEASTAEAAPAETVEEEKKEEPTPAPEA